MNDGNITANTQVTVEEIIDNQIATRDYSNMSLAQLNTVSININGVSYNFDSKRISFTQLMEMSADLQAGAQIEVDPETKKSTIIITKEFAMKELKVKVDLAFALFAINLNIDQIDPEIWLELIDIVDASGFIKRLANLKKSNG